MDTTFFLIQNVADRYEMTSNLKNLLPLTLAKVSG